MCKLHVHLNMTTFLPLFFFITTTSLVCVAESTYGQGDLSYVDLGLNPERYTGYAGFSARRVWGAIYEENCFRYCVLPLHS